MTQKKAIIVKSPTPPANTEVLWLDLSSDPPQLKSFINGGWKQLNSESTEVTDLRNELNASINEVNSTLNDKIDTKVSTLDDKIDASIDVLNDKIDDEIAVQTETSQGIQEDLDGTKTRVATLEDTYEDTMNIANQQINELIDGKAQIAQALTDRGYPTQATDSSASMAQKIENMAYDAGWLAQLGYTEQNDGGVKEAVAYSKSIMDGWDASDTTRRFTGDTQLKYFPMVDTSHFNSFNKMFQNCTSLSHVPAINTSNVADMSNAFENTALTKMPNISVANVVKPTSMFAGSKIEEFPYLSFDNATSFAEVFPQKVRILHGVNIPNVARLTDSPFYGTAYTLERLEELNIPKVYEFSGSRFWKLDGQGYVILKFFLIKNLGTPSNCTNTQYMTAILSQWGSVNEENRQSLVDSLLTYSFDRAAANYSACTVKLHADTLARLTAEEIAAITAKGFTLTS